jgi:hypothetical protein
MDFQHSDIFLFKNCKKNQNLPNIHYMAHLLG